MNNAQQRSPIRLSDFCRGPATRATGQRALRHERTPCDGPFAASHTSVPRGAVATMDATGRPADCPLWNRGAIRFPGADWSNAAQGGLHDIGNGDVRLGVDVIGSDGPGVAGARWRRRPRQAPAGRQRFCQYTTSVHDLRAQRRNQTTSASWPCELPSAHSKYRTSRPSAQHPTVPPWSTALPAHRESRCDARKSNRDQPVARSCRRVASSRATRGRAMSTAMVTCWPAVSESRPSSGVKAPPAEMEKPVVRPLAVATRRGR